MHTPELPAPTTMTTVAERPEVPFGLLDAIDQVPTVRIEFVERVRARLASGEAPSADQLADRIIAGFVADRLLAYPA